MPIVTLFTKVVNLNEGEQVTIRQLGWRALQRARAAKEQDAWKLMSELGSMFESALSDNDAAQSARRAALADPLSAYDQEVVLHEGIVEWNYENEGYPIPVSEKNINGLDEETAHKLALEIIGFSVGEQAQADRKNSSAPSTDT